MLLKNSNILVVDDVVLMCDFMYGVAVQLGDCRVFKALDGKTAAEILENETIDLLITDLEMKSPTGLELVYRVRARHFAATSHDIPIIIFSGNTYLELIKHCIRFDVNDFLAKPLTGARLSKKIQYHLKTEKLIQSPEHYQLAGAEIFYSDKSDENGYERKIRVSIVRELTSQEDKSSQDNKDSESRVPEKDFLFWPENSTTGYFQLDRRLRNLAFNVSCFHNAFINNSKAVAIECERKRACDAIDYLLHISKNISSNTQSREFARLFSVRIEKLKPLAAELARIDIKYHKGVLDLLKKFSYWWMQTCNRPIIQRNDETEEEGLTHGS